jgi:ProP effector
MTDAVSPETPIISARDLLKQFQQQYPAISEHQPLAIGIDKQLLAAHPETNRKQLRGALAMHTRSMRYLKNLQTAKQRVNLDGSTAGEVSDAQRELAATELRERFKKRAQEHKAQEQARAKAEKEARAEQERQEKLRQLTEKFATRR